MIVLLVVPVALRFWGQRGKGVGVVGILFDEALEEGRR